MREKEYYMRYEPMFGAWHMDDMIGKGGFGEVYGIWREEMGITYRSALKAITVPASEDEILSARSEGMNDRDLTIYYENMVRGIVQEIQFMARLKGNSNIVCYEDHRIFRHKEDFGWDILIKMEKLTPLLDHALHHPLTEDDVVRMGIDICRGLAVCRKQSIIHRDVKPENIFISDNGDFKLGDFGIASTIERASTGRSVKGSYTYMAPEVYFGCAYGPSVDLYSLGIVMYKFLNGGRTPFLPDDDKVLIPEERMIALKKRLGGAEIPPPKGGSDMLKKIVLKACSFRESDRYETAEEMQEELEAFQRGDVLGMNTSRWKAKMDVFHSAMKNIKMML